MPTAHCLLKRMVGRAVRQRGANASRPFGSRRFDPCTIRQCGRSSMEEPLSSKQKMRVRFSPPAPRSPRSCCGRVQSSLRGIAQSVERGFHTPRQPQVRSLLPRPAFCRLAKWEGNGSSWRSTPPAVTPRHEAVRLRQLVRACSSSVERRPPKPRQRGFNSFLARHHRSGRSQCSF